MGNEKKDYIVINQRYRNIAARTWASQGWIGNVQRQRQHDVIRMDITLKLLHTYHQPYRKETGTQIQYDITSRNKSWKISKWYKQRYENTENIDPIITNSQTDIIKQQKQTQKDPHTQTAQENRKSYKIAYIMEFKKRSSQTNTAKCKN